MAETYDILYDGKVIGTAQMEKCGLYYQFSCRCHLPDEGMYRIHVVYEDAREDLGICVPIDGAFGMDKKIAAKYLGKGDPYFELHPKDWKQQIATETEPEKVSQEEPVTMEEPEIPETDNRIFVMVSEEKPFDYLDKLEGAVTEIRSDCIGVVIPK